MSIKNNMITLILIALSGFAPWAYAEGDADAGRYKSETCLGCHGIEGYKNTYPTFRVPKLKGQHPAYIIMALKAYRAEQRDHGTMRSQASMLSDQDIEDIAAYIGTLK